MKLKLMKWIDQWVGMPVCFILGLFCSIFRRFRPRATIKPDQIKQIAIFKFFGIGSIVQASPLLRGLRQRYPNATLHFVTFAGNEGALNLLGLVDQIHILRTRSLFLFGYDMLALLFTLWRRHIQVTIDLEFFSKFSTLLTFMTGATIRIGFHLNDFWRSSLVKHPIYFNYFRHIGEIYADVGRHLDFQITDFQLPAIPLDNSLRSSVQDSLAALGWNRERRLVGVNINANDFCLERRWPQENWRALLETVSADNPDILFILTGSRNESAYVSEFHQSLSESCRNRIVMGAGKWTLEEFMALLAMFDLFLTNDSGPMHLAALTQTRTVSLWGPGRPSFYEPPGGKNLSLYFPLHCSPCLYMFTSLSGMWCHHEGTCMKAIQVNDVLEAAYKMLPVERLSKETLPSS